MGLSTDALAAGGTVNSSFRHRMILMSCVLLSRQKKGSEVNKAVLVSLDKPLCASYGLDPACVNCPRHYGGEVPEHCVSSLGGSR